MRFCTAAGRAEGDADSGINKKKEREKRQNSDHLLLSAFISHVGTSLGRGYLGRICPLALPDPSCRKGLFFPSLSKELGSALWWGGRWGSRCHRGGEGEENTDTQGAPQLAQLSPFGSCPAAILPCQIFLGWALRAPVVIGMEQGDGSPWRERGKAEDSPFPCGMCWAGSGEQPGVVMSQPRRCDNSSSLGIQVAARVGHKKPVENARLGLNPSPSPSTSVNVLRESGRTEI